MKEVVAVEKRDETLFDGTKYTTSDQSKRKNLRG